MTRLLLASASPARRATLLAAGIEPLVAVSGVDEEAVLAAAHERFGALDPADAVLLLAQAKVEDVSRNLPEELEDADDLLLLGCDSMLELDGEIYGKPVGRCRRDRPAGARCADGPACCTPGTG